MSGLPTPLRDHFMGQATACRGLGSPFTARLCDVFAVRIEAEGKSVAYTGDTEWTPDLIPAARDADLFIAEAYFRDKTIATHLSLNAIEANLAEMAPRRLVLTHMSDDMLGRIGELNHIAAYDGMIVEF